MTLRNSSSFIVSALAFALVAAPTFLSQAQTNAPAAPADTNAAPAAPAATPAPAPAAPADTNAAPAAAPTERPTTYTMVTGDSLDSVAKKFDTSIRALAKLNKIPKEKYRKLRAGTVLQIPPAKSDATTK
jgi:LysM repeat protein